MNNFIWVLNNIGLVGVLLFSVIALLQVSLFRYIGERFKNTATKKDTAKITKLVEDIKHNNAIEIEKIKSELGLKTALQQAFQTKCLEAITKIDELLVEIHLYSWGQLAMHSPNEHYVWDNMKAVEDNRNYHYYYVAIDKLQIDYGLYLTSSGRDSLSVLAEKIGMLSNMELSLSNGSDSLITTDAIESSYSSAIKEVNLCRNKLMSELGIK